MKIRTGCQHVGYFHYSEHLNWATQKLRPGRGLDVAGLNCQKPWNSSGKRCNFDK